MRKRQNDSLHREYVHGVHEVGRIDNRIDNRFYVEAIIATISKLLNQFDIQDKDILLGFRSITSSQSRNNFNTRYACTCSFHRKSYESVRRCSDCSQRSILNITVNNDIMATTSSVNRQSYFECADAHIFSLQT